MNWTPVTSSAFRAVRYDPASRSMDVLFHNQTITRYHRVPQRVHIKLVGHVSPGSYLNTGVKPFFESIELPHTPDELLPLSGDA